jgi:sphinganine-1-phosphate aldolase
VALMSRDFGIAGFAKNSCLDRLRARRIADARMAADRVPLSVFISDQASSRPVSHVVIGAVLGATAAQIAFNVLHDGDLPRRTLKSVFAGVRRLLNRYVQKEVDKAADDIHFPTGGPYESFSEIPKQGLSKEKVLELCGALQKSLDKNMADDRLSGVVYVGTTGKTEVISEVIKAHLWSNPLFADYFGATRKIEAEVVQMMISVFNGRTTGVPKSEQQVGCYTFGGTESVLMAMLAMRNYAREARGIKRPNVIVPTTAHPAFDKAAQYFDLRIIKVAPEPGTFAVSAEEMEKHITYETIGMVGSAPSFAHGTVDPIEELSEVALRRGILLHVDACLGGMLIQWMQAAGLQQPRIDFRVKGVTSISCDIHKWGGSPKGASVVLYRGAWLRQHQTFAFADYPGGLYVTASINGSKAGYVIAAAWATLLSTGKAEYVDNVRRVVTATKAFEVAVDSTPLLRVIGRPEVSTLAFTSDVLDIYTVKARLAEKGWIMNPCQFPPAIHLGTTLEHCKPGAMAQLIGDLNEVVEKLAVELGFPTAADAEAAYRAGKLRVKQKHQSMVYGSTQSIPDRNIIEQVLRRYVDVYYTNESVAS